VSIRPTITRLFSLLPQNSMLRLTYRPTCSHFGKLLAPAHIRTDWIRIERVQRQTQIARMGSHSKILLKDIPYTVRPLSQRKPLYHICPHYRHDRQFSTYWLTSSLQFKDPSIIDNRCFVGGKWISAATGKTFAVLGTEKLLPPPLPARLSNHHIMHPQTPSTTPP
jgi:hypothetical protein